MQGTATHIDSCAIRFRMQKVHLCTGPAESFRSPLTRCSPGKVKNHFEAFQEISFRKGIEQGVQINLPPTGILGQRGKLSRERKSRRMIL